MLTQFKLLRSYFFNKKNFNLSTVTSLATTTPPPPSLESLHKNRLMDKELEPPECVKTYLLDIFYVESISTESYPFILPAFSKKNY